MLIHLVQVLPNLLKHETCIDQKHQKPGKPLRKRATAFGRLGSDLEKNTVRWSHSHQVQSWQLEIIGYNFPPAIQCGNGLGSLVRWFSWISWNSPKKFPIYKTQDFPICSTISLGCSGNPRARRNWSTQWSTRSTIIPCGENDSTWGCDDF